MQHVPPTKLEGVASSAILSALCSRQSRSPSSKLEGVVSIRKHRQRRGTKPFAADRNPVVAQGERQRELPAGKMLQEPLHAAAVEFDGAAADSGTATRAKADDAKSQAEECVRRGPEEGEDRDAGSGGHFDEFSIHLPKQARQSQRYGSKETSSRHKCPNHRNALSPRNESRLPMLQVRPMPKPLGNHDRGDSRYRKKHW